MKKFLAVILAIVMAFAVTVPAFAVSVCDFDALVNEFSVYKADNGMTYAAFEPALEEGVKYPLVIYIHGLGHGWNDETFKQSGLTYWAADEMQAKFNAGGAYLLMPKIPENVISAMQGKKVFNLIEEYVKLHSDTIDMNQIFIMGGSAGGGLAWRVLTAHPDYFNKAVILCGDKKLTKNEAKAIADVPVWMISARTDHLVWYFLFSDPNWTAISKYSNVKSMCRHTVFSSKVQLPDGSNAVISHLLAKTIGYNFCRLADNQLLDGMDTVNADGRKVELSFDDGIIEWLQK